MHTFRPADFEILRILSEGRNVPVNIAQRLDNDEWDRKYIGMRLRRLVDNGLVRHIGTDRSGLYEITDKGDRAYDHRDLYTDANKVEFYLMVEEYDVDALREKLEDDPDADVDPVAADA